MSTTPNPKPPCAHQWQMVIDAVKARRGMRPNEHLAVYRCRVCGEHKRKR